MKSILLGILLILSVSGCGGPVDEQSATATPKPGDANIAELSQSIRIAPSLNDDDRPATLEEFAERFREMYSRNVQLPFIELAKWDTYGDENSQAYLNAFAVNGVARSEQAYEIIELKFEQIGNWGFPYHPSMGDQSMSLTLLPTHVMLLTVSQGDNLEIGPIAYAVGFDDQHYYFATPSS